MSYSCDFDGPSCYGETHRRARKQHKCAECRRPILPGQTYVYASGVWDGRGGDYKWCLRCDRLMKAYMAADDCDCGVTIGTLRSAVVEFFDNVNMGNGEGFWLLMKSRPPRIEAPTARKE